MDMQNYTTPFANTGDREEFSIDTDPSGKVSLEKGWTELYQLRPEEGGLFILRKVFNQMMKLVSTDTVTWKTQSFPNWIDDKGDGLPYAYPKNALVKYTDGNTYVSKIDNNTDIPTDTDSWVNFEDFGSLNINELPEKITPENTDNLALQETDGLLKKLSWANLKATLVTYLSTGTGFAISLTTNGYIKFPSWLGGLIIQWGTTGTLAQNSTIVVNLPIAFPTAFLNASVSYNSKPSFYNGTGALAVLRTSLSQLSITKAVNGSGAEDLLTTQWFAIGY